MNLATNLDLIWSKEVWHIGFQLKTGILFGFYYFNGE
jgi:hypothetical protein